MLVTVISSINTLNGKRIHPQHTYSVAMFNAQLKEVTHHIDHQYRKLNVDGVDMEFLVETTLSDQQALDLIKRL